MPILHVVHILQLIVMIVGGFQVVHDCSMDLVGRERFTEPLELRMSLGASRPPQLLGRKWLAHREPSVSATEPSADCFVDRQMETASLI